MATVKAGLIQMSLRGDAAADSPATISEKMIAAHMPLIEDAAHQGVQVLALQEIFNQPYFPASEDIGWYGAAEPIPDGPTTAVMREVARKHAMVMVVPVYERTIAGVYYNSAAVIDADGSYLGIYRK